MNLYSASNAHTRQWRRVFMLLPTIRLNGLMAVSAVLFLICTIAQIFIRVTAHNSQARNLNDFVTISIVPTLECQRKDASTPRAGTRRPTLAESLPAGSIIIESRKMLGGIEVILANGLHISARGASVTASGISFKGPYQIKEPTGGSLASQDVGSVCLLARDGSFKLIPSAADNHSK